MLVSFGGLLDICVCARFGKDTGIGWAGLAGAFCKTCDYFGTGQFNGANLLFAAWAVLSLLCAAVYGPVDLLVCGSGRSDGGHFGGKRLCVIFLLRTGWLTLHLARVPAGALPRFESEGTSMLSTYCKQGRLLRQEMK